MMKSFARVVAALLTISAASAQGVGQLPSGSVWGNSTAARAPAAPATLTAMFDRAYSSTQGAFLYRNAANWLALAPGTAGLPLVSGGAGANLSYAILGLSAGGCNANLTASNGGILYSTASACAILAATATAQQMLQSGASGAPAWSTATWPATVAQGDLLYGSAANAVTALAKSATATRYVANTGASNSPTWDQINLANGVTGALPVANGGTNCLVASATCLDNITAFASTGIMSRTGAATYTFSTLSALIDAIGSTRGAILYRGAAGWAILGPGSATNVLSSGGAGADPSWVAASSGGTVTSAVIAAGTAITVSGTCTITTTGTCTINVDKATAANYYAATSNKVPTTDIIYPSEVTITYGATTTIDFDTLINGAVTLTGNITTLTLSNVRAGKAGMITFIQDATGSRTWPAGGNTVFKYGGGTLPALSTTASAIDILNYSCRSATFCQASLNKDVRNP